MPFAATQDVITNFLSTNKPEILVISGGWGTGKTYIWKSTFRKTQASNGVACKQYSYVSLFGRNTLDDIRSTIIESTIDVDSFIYKPDVNSLAKMFNQGKRLGEFLGRRFHQVNTVVPGMNKYFDVSRMLFMTLSSQIVCFDDIERAGPQLSLGTIMGLAASLRDEKDCKVLLLLNEDALRKDSELEYRRQLEKIADRTIKFNPTAEQVRDIVITQGGVYEQRVSENLISLKIRNIRIAKRAVSLGVEFAQELNGADLDLRLQAIDTVVLAVVCKFDAENFMTLDEMRAYNNGPIPEDEAEKAKYERHQGILKGYRFGHADEFDLALIDGVDKGYIENEKLQEMVEKSTETLISRRSISLIREAWSEFRSSFNGTAHDIMGRICDVMISNINYCTLHQWDGLIEMLRDLDMSERADEMIGIYYDRRQNDMSAWDIEEPQTWFSVKDERLLEVAQERRDALSPRRTIIEVMHSAALSRSYNDDEIGRVCLIGEDAWFLLLRSVFDRDYINIMSGVNFFTRIKHTQQNARILGEQLSKALQRISDLDPINKKRLELWKEVSL